MTIEPTLDPQGESKLRSFCLDWIQYTVPWPESVRLWPEDAGSARAALGTALPNYTDLTGEIGKPILGYEQAYLFDYGTIYVSPSSPRQKILVAITGNQCHRSWCRNGLWYDQVMRWLHDKDCHLTRLDVAMDLYTEDAPVREIIDLWKSGRIESSARTILTFASEKKHVQKTYAGETIYFGAPASSRRLVIYDKSAEQRVDFAWTRVEIRLRDAHAMQFVTACLTPGGSMQSAFLAVASEMLTVKVDSWWQKAMIGEKAALGSMPRRETDTTEWIRKVVIPLVVRVTMQEVYDSNYALFDALTEMMSEIADYAQTPDSGPDGLKE